MQLCRKSGKCKPCVKEYNRIRGAKNKDTIKAYNKNYKTKNKESLKKQRKVYVADNRKKIAAYQKEYDAQNKDKQLARNRKFYVNNKKNITSKKSQAATLRKKSDPSFRLRVNCSSLVRTYLLRNGSRKDGKSILKYLPYTMSDLKNHIESLFESWMTWDNYGMYGYKTWVDNDQSTWKWNIDHIIPQSALPYTSMIDDNFQKIWSLNNLRPYSAKQNVIDRDRKK